jgi:hypothetical protein
MRDPARIDGVLAALKEVWERDPDLRLGQLMMNAVKPESPCREMFYIEDDMLLQGLLNYARLRGIGSARGCDDLVVLRRAVGEVLHYIWDPIGVAGSPHARDEYDGYVEPICNLLWRGADHATLVRHLLQISEQQMGIPHRLEEAERAADKLLQWREIAARGSGAL